MQSEFRFAVWMRKVPGVCVPDPLCARGQGAWLWLMLSAEAVCGAGSSCSPSRGEKKNLAAAPFGACLEPPRPGVSYS